MGAYKYVSELWRKKQSDVMRFLQRVRCWEYRQLPSIVRVTRPTRPDKARRLGYKAKQGYVIYRVRVRRGGRKRPVPKGIVYGKPKHQGITQLKFQRNKRSVAEERAGRKLGGLRVLNSYWVNEDSTYKYYEIILIDPAHGAIRNDPRINWICKGVHKHRELRGLTSAGKKYRGLRGKGHLHHKARPSRRATWKRNQTLSLRRYPVEGEEEEEKLEGSRLRYCGILGLDKRMPRPPDIGWQYGTMIGGHRHHVQCNYCHRIMIGGITRFKKHLASKRGEIKGCDAVPKEVREIIAHHLATRKPRRPNKRRRKTAEGTSSAPISTNYSVESDASDPDMTNVRREVLTFNEAEVHSQRTSEQQFEIGTRGFIDAFSCIQYKDEQDFMPTRATDIGWAHGAMVNGDRQKIECKYCHKVILGGGISRLKQHLAGERGNIAPCDQVPADVKAQMQQHLGFKVLENCNVQQNTEEYNGDALKVTPISPTAASHRRRGKDEGYSKRRKKVEMLGIPQGSTFPLSTVQLSFASQEIIDQADITVAKFMYESGVPLSAANSVYFQRMADAIAAVGPGYKMPSHHSLRGKLLSRCTTDAEEISKELRKSWEVTGCTVLVDRLMDTAGRSIINIFVYCPKGTMFLKSVDVSQIETTLEGLVHLFESIIQDVGPGNIVHFLLDSAPWYKAAGKVLMDKYKTFFWSVCVNHCMELMFKGLSEMDEVYSVIAKAKKITQLIYNDAWLLNLLKKTTEGRDLIRPGMTQSITDHLTLQNIFSLKDSLQQMFTCDSWDESVLSKQKLGMSVKNIVFDLQFWQSCANIIKKGLLDCIETLEPDLTAQDNITKHKSFYEDSLGDFSRPLALRGRESLPPAAWWSMYASDYPDLQRFAVRILSQTCSMPSFRRNCYINEYTHSSKNRLERVRLNDTTFVHYNLHLQEGQPVATESKGLINGENDLLSISSYDAGDWIDDPGILEVEGINLLDVTLPGGPLPVIDKAGSTSDGNLVIDD
ncbi:hypothetical protein OPV22_033014 [Ensete ventricosum]|uniref:Ribosomal protein L15 n=1 Tax=Ensete ventricosum TaxID=4639 RepID=A0AAV8PSX7_ENSVE|nr:hypothetical protein OPV22_033014 [Ensete ventricosum]